MRDLEDEIADLDIGIELFANLAYQRRGVRLAFVDLAAREFPQAGEVDAFLAAGHEKRAVLLDDCRDDDDHGFVAAAALARPMRGNEVHDRVIGHASHFGFRAVQIVAPKSMSA